MEVGILDPVVTINDASVNAVSWSFALDGVLYDLPSFTHTFSDGGVFPVELTVTSGPGCEDKASITVVVRDHLFYAPNSFTPNGDELNDAWVPQVFGARLYDLVIYDRWGQVVFHTTDPKEGWDGGEQVQGAYSYAVQLAEFGPLDRRYTGVITLIR
jgi:gliding motility-associated-like protein